MLPRPGVPSRLRTIVAGVALTLSAAACGESLARPAFAPQPREGWQRVPYPAPAVLVQDLGPPSSGGAVWLDGHWEWDVRTWKWKPGGWVRPEPGARYAKPAYARLADGALVYAPGRWVVGGKAKVEPAENEEAGPTAPCPCDPPGVSPVAGAGAGAGSNAPKGAAAAFKGRAASAP